MKKILSIVLIANALVLSGCAILLGIPPVPQVGVGNMIVGVSAKTAYLYVSTDNPEPMEASLPFFGSLKFYYKDAVYDSLYGYSGISIYNDELDMDFKAIPYGKLNNESPDKFPSEGNDSTKAVALFNNFFVDDFTNISADIGYNAENRYTYKCFTRMVGNQPQDVCGTVRFTEKGNVIFFAMQSTSLGAEKVKKNILETINSVEFHTHF
jgi:hypothetical protein